MENIYHECGFISEAGSTWEYFYQLKDHLGTNRVIFKANGSTTDVVQEFHSYAYGAPISGLASTNRATDYTYTDQELNEDFGLDWYDYGARCVDMWIARFTGVDPAAEDYIHWSPYIGLLNNPLIVIDPSGAFAIHLEGEDAQKAFLSLKNYYTDSPPNEYLAVHNEDGSVDYQKVSNKGRDEYDIIHHQKGNIPEQGASMHTEVVFNEGGNRLKPGVFLPPMATGAITPVDDPFTSGEIAALKGGLFLLTIIKTAGEKKAAKLFISLQKQAGHVKGTPQYLNRIKANKPTSVFFGEKSADALTRVAWLKGSPVKGKNNVREFDFGVAVGSGPNGGMQTKVRVHMDKKGRIHGHPSGPEKF